MTNSFRAGIFSFPAKDPGDRIASRGELRVADIPGTTPQIKIDNSVMHAVKAKTR
jgi:hypothetical protein